MLHLTACKQYCLAAGETQGNIAYTQNVTTNCRERMTKHYSRQIIFILLIANVISIYSQTNLFQDKFSKLFDFKIVPKTNPNFKEYYEITIQQSLDHSNPKDKFTQRIFVGFQDFNAPTVIITDGYAIDYASKADYSNELTTELKANSR